MNHEIMDPLESVVRGDVILRLPEVKSRTGLSTTTLYGLVKAGLFPRQIQLGPRAVGWVEREIDSFIAQRMAERSAK